MLDKSFMLKISSEDYHKMVLKCNNTTVKKGKRYSIAEFVRAAIKSKIR